MDDGTLAGGYAGSMLDYARQRIRVALCTPRRVVLATSGPGGIQAGEFACEAADLSLFLLVPKTSDHLFNLEHDSRVIVLAPGWEIRGKATIISPASQQVNLELLGDPAAQWCALVKVDPHMLQIRRKEGWGFLETLELNQA